MKQGSGARRLGERVYTRKTGQIIDESGCVTEVSVLDVSLTGARIETSFGAVLPARFQLRIGRDGVGVEAELVWRDKTEAGIRFVTESVETAKPQAVTTPVVRRMSVAELRGLARASTR